MTNNDNNGTWGGRQWRQENWDKTGGSRRNTSQAPATTKWLFQPTSSIIFYEHPRPPVCTRRCLTLFPRGERAKRRNHASEGQRKPMRMVRRPNACVHLLVLPWWRVNDERQHGAKTTTPMQDWPVKSYTGLMRPTAGSLSGQRQVIFEEYER